MVKRKPIYVSLPDEGVERPLVFYLAMEEYLARRFSGAFFFIWQTGPTVIYGRNQLLEAEVNVKYCNEHGIKMFRRKSGGGCVYSDWGNIMLSYVTPTSDVEKAFDDYLSRLSSALCSLGVNAERSGRNDVLIDGRKVSGNAFYSLSSMSIVHGTLLYDTDIENMTYSITPPLQKLSSKGVDSVRSRITLLKDSLEALKDSGAAADIEGLKAFLRRWFCDEEMTLTDEQILDIEEIEKTYLDKDFMYGRSPEYSIEKSSRIEGAGTVTAMISVKKSLIVSVEVSGDYFALKPGLGDELTALLKGVEFTEEKVREKIGNFQTNQYIYKLETPELIKLLLS